MGEGGRIIPKGDLREWLPSRLQPLSEDAGPRGLVGSDLDLNPQYAASGLAGDVFRPAAVLVPIIERAGGLQVLFTIRSSALNNHAGQVSFPGGRIDAAETAMAAALRETHEEIGVAPHHIAPLGRLDTYETGTGFRIFPIVGVLPPDISPILNPAEVEDVFEVPLDFLMDISNRKLQSMVWQGSIRHFYAMTYNEHTIWGATAAILVNLRSYLAAQ